MTDQSTDVCPSVDLFREPATSNLVYDNDETKLGVFRSGVPQLKQLFAKCWNTVRVSTEASSR